VSIIPNPNPMPSFRWIYWADFTIRRAIHATVLGLMLAAGMWWLTRPMPNAPPLAEPSFEAMYGPWVSLGGLLLAAVGGAVLLWRYLLVKRIITQGISVKGTVDEVDIYDTNSRSDSSRIRTTPTYAYYVGIRYAVHGVEHRVRFKLLHSPSTYGMKKDGDVDLVVVDSMPRKPLIRAVYLEPPRHRPGALFRL
jgi:hypothetical protein